MCRLLAYWGMQPRSVADLLVEAPNSLLKQSEQDSTGRPNPDGWGIAYLKDGEVRLIKKPLPAYRDRDFLQIARDIRSELVFAHIRRRSHGAICYENTHPFVKDRWAFMHNGMIPDFSRVCEKLIEKHFSGRKPEVFGTTDSEFMFHFVLQKIKEDDPAGSQCSLAVLQGILQELVALVSPEDYSKMALNFLLTNGQCILGYRLNRSLFYRLDANGVFISSEIPDESLEWKEIPEEHFLLCTRPDEVHLIHFPLGITSDEQVQTL